MSLIEEKDAIREVLAEYCFRLDGGDYEGMAALFTEDGTWDTAFGKGIGWAAIAQLARDIRARAGENRPRAIHLVTNIIITIDDRRGSRVSRSSPSGTSTVFTLDESPEPVAEVRSNWTVVQNSPEGPKIGSGGGYADRMIKQGGVWRFHYRKIDRFIVG